MLLYCRLSFYFVVFPSVFLSVFFVFISHSFLFSILPLWTVPFFVSAQKVKWISRVCQPRIRMDRWALEKCPDTSRFFHFIQGNFFSSGVADPDRNWFLNKIRYGFFSNGQIRLRIYLYTHIQNISEIELILQYWP